LKPAFALPLESLALRLPEGGLLGSNPLSSEIQVDEHADLGEEGGRVDGLDEKIHGTLRVRDMRVRLFRRVRGEEDDRDTLFWRTLPNPRRRLKAVEVGHSDVHENDGELALGDAFQSFRAGVCPYQILAERREHRFECEEVGRVVVDQQDPDATVRLVRSVLAHVSSFRSTVSQRLRVRSFARPRRCGLDFTCSRRWNKVCDKKRRMAERLRVLVVEDDPDIRELVGECLRNRFSVTLAEDGVGALALLAQPHQDFGAIVLDLEMPRLSGTSLLEELRVRQIGVPVLILSGIPDARRRAKGLRAEFMPKPFEVEQLQQKVEQLVDAA
jgi:CheY-like chemotaxis protein